MELVSLALGSAGGIAATRALAGLREHRVAPQGLADLVNWGFMVADGVVLQKDGSLVAGWRYRGPDLSAATPEELNGLARRLSHAVLRLTDDWMFHFDAIRRPAAAYPRSAFPDPITQLIDDERRAAYEAQAGRQFETEYFLVATHVPPPDAVSRLGAFFVRGAKRGRPEWARVVETFSADLVVLQLSLVAAGLELEWLAAERLLTHLHECLTGLAHPVRLPPHGSYLNVVLADQELLGGFEPRIGQLAIRAVAVQGYPHASHPGQCDFLNTLPFAFRWSNRVIPLGTHEAARHIRRHQLQWFKKRKGAGAWVQDLVGGKKDAAPRPDDELWLDQDARHMAEDAARAAAENASGAVRFCFYTPVILVMQPEAERATAVAREIVKVLNDAGFSARVETVNALEAYLGSLPGHGYPNLRRPLLSTRNVADLLPLTSVWPGLPRNPSPFFPSASPPLLWAQTAGTPFRLNLHDSDVGHTLVLGRTGSGKSVLLALLAAQFRRYPNAQVFVFDVGYSMWPLAQAAGALHYDLAAHRPDALRFQPLGGIDQPAERAWAAEWLETLLALQGASVTPGERMRIDRALELVALNDRAHRTLTELAVQLQDETLAAALRPYIVGGNYGQLLDAGTDDLAAGAFQVFELKHLLALDDRIALPVLLYLFRRIEQRLDGRPTLIEIDEAWMALVHSLFGARVNQWLLQLRKQNAAVVLATQSPAQLAQLPHRHTIIDSCVTKLYLPNPDAQTPAQAPLYRELGLNAREIAIIGQATPKRHYYFKSPRGSRLFELGLGPLALSFLAPASGASIDETRSQIQALQASHNGSWPAAWLDTRGLHEWAERFRAHVTA